jgi:hypothetical protein
MLLAVLVILALSFFAIVSPLFRSILLVVAAIGGGLLVYAYNNQQKASEVYRRQRASAEGYATTAITINDLSFSNVALNHVLDMPMRWALEGNVANNSKHELKSIVFQVTLRDCEKVGSIDTCNIVGQENIQAIDLKVPPGQTRAFKSSTFEFRNLPKHVGTCTSNPCPSTRQFNWVVYEIRAGN